MKKYFWATTLLCALLSVLRIGGLASAETPDKDRAEEKAFAEFRNSPKGYKEIIKIAQLALGRFGYGVGPFDGKMDSITQGALRKYQKSNKLEPSGEVDFKTMSALGRDMEAIEEPGSVPRSLNLLDQWDDWAIVSGVWVEQGHETENPSERFVFSQFRCEKRLKLCIESEATMRGDDLVSVESTLHEVVRWDELEIATEPHEAPLCVRYTTRVNRATKKVTRNRYPKQLDGACDGMENREIIFYLSDRWGGAENHLRRLKKYNADVKRIVLMETK